MRRIKRTFGKLSLIATCCLLPITVMAAIESDFDDTGYPGTSGRGWAGEWSNTGDGVPEVISDAPLEDDSAYLHVDLSGTPGGYRNVFRAYESGGGADVSETHRIRWRFRLEEPQSDFESNFTTFNDRVHFFSRDEPRPNGGTDASMSWGIFAVGEAHSSGVGGGKTFWIYDNVTGDSGFNTENALDTGIALRPGEVYTFEVTVNPGNQLYLVNITNEATGKSFTSSSPHAFRDLSASATSHTILHFGVRADSEEARAFDLDGLSITPAPGEVPVPPEIVSLSPLNHGVQKPGAGIQFEVTSESSIPESGIGLVLNGKDVSDQLTITGQPTQREARFNNLMPDQEYTAEITVTSEGGTVTRTIEFMTVETSKTVYDSGGFADDTIYPTGPLESVSHGDSEWLPASEPAEVVDLEDGEHGKVLRRAQTGDSNTDILDFPQSASGVLSVAFDARVSTSDQRTLDLFLLPEQEDGMASLLGWGINPGKVSYFDGSAWVAVADLDTGWHHYEMVNFLSGPLAETFNLKVDGEVVARGLTWRHSFPKDAAFGQLRVGGIRGPEGEYGEIDNLTVSISPEPPPPPQIGDIMPSHRTQFHSASEGFEFSVSSEEAIPKEGILVTLNGEDITDNLTFSGEPPDRTIRFENLKPNRVYEADIEVTNDLGTSAATVQFDTIAKSTVVFDTQGFENDSLYPVGSLSNVTDGIGNWTAGRSGSPAEIVTSESSERGKVLRRAQAETGSVDILDFTPFSSGILTVEFDARVSTTSSRTIDMALNRTGQTQRASFLSWGEISGELAFYDGEQWNGFTELTEGWHHYEVIHYLNGPKAQTFDIKIDGELVGEGLPWEMNFEEGTPFGRLRIGAVNGTAGEYGDIDNLQIGMTPPPPAITSLSPEPMATFHPAEEGLELQIQSAKPIATEDIEISLNGEDITTAATIGGDPTSRSISFTDLAPNRIYQVEIEVTNALGTSRSTFRFDTFSEEEVRIVEAEDYNYQNGQFQDNPPPSGFAEDGTMVNGNGEGYLDLQGTSGVDYSVTPTPSEDPQQSYRFLDDVNTRPTDDFLRQKYAEAGVPDFEVWSITADDWMNYTRIFEGGEYRPYLRVSSTGEQSIRLDRVTGDRTQPDHTTSSVGTFDIPDTDNDYEYVPLTDDQGNPKTVQAEDVTTFRLTVEETEGAVGMNFILFAPVSEEPRKVVLMQPTVTAEGFEVSFSTETDVEYTVQYTETLGNGSWSDLETVLGNGSTQRAQDPMVEAAHRFYRVVIE